MQTWLSSLQKFMTHLDGDVLYKELQSLKIYVYKNTPLEDHNPKSKPGHEFFLDKSAFFDLLKVGDYGTVEASFTLLRRLDPPKARTIALLILQTINWYRLDESAIGELSNKPDHESIPALIHRFTISPLIQQYTPLKILGNEEWQTLTKLNRIQENEKYKAAMGDPWERLNLEKLIKLFGEYGQSVTLSLLMKIYLDHPNEKLRLRAGHALIDSGSKEAWLFLCRLYQRQDEWSSFFGIKAMFMVDPKHVWDEVEKEAMSPEGLYIASVIKKQLELNLRNSTKDYTTPWLLQDNRWAAMLAYWRRDRKYGEGMEILLNRYPKEIIAQAIQEADEKRTVSETTADMTSFPKINIPSITTLPDKYHAGKYKEVWNELMLWGAHVRQDKVLDVALHIARETMKRVREQLEQVVEELKQEGYTFIYPHHVLTAPEKDKVEKLKQLNILAGGIPISLQAFYEEVGSCSLEGYHPEWPLSHVNQFKDSNTEVIFYSDPLVVTSLENAQDQANDHLGDSPLTLEISADEMGKAGYSAGLYSMELPTLNADITIKGISHEPLFIDYLRKSLRNGGFAGFDNHKRVPPLIKKFRELFKGF